jgi:hypothetical protein
MFTFDIDNKCTEKYNDPGHAFEIAELLAQLFQPGCYCLHAFHIKINLA